MVIKAHGAHTDLRKHGHQSSQCSHWSESETWKQEVAFSPGRTKGVRPIQMGVVLHVA